MAAVVIALVISGVFCLLGIVEKFWDALEEAQRTIEEARTLGGGLDE